jgi:hypothetical protein
MATFVDLAVNIFNLNGAPLKLPYETMRHLWPIYNRPDRTILLKFGRQTHKSTTLAFKMSLPCVRYPDYHVLYVAPTGNQVSVFSTDKLDNALRDSSFIQKYYIDVHTKDQVFYKETCNRSKIYLRSAFHSADSIRGITADSLYVDEIQDIVSDHVPVIEQCMAHSLAKWEHIVQNSPDLPMHLFKASTYAGTPKNIENTLEKYWAKSTQSEWIIKCLHCNKYNYINEKNIGPTCLICNKCGKPIYYKDGSWISMNSDGFIKGYRCPQIIFDWINNPRNPEAWKESVTNPMKVYSSQKFFNEVLALPYANAKNPLNHHDIKSACKDYDNCFRPDAYEWLKKIELYAGVDWGKGDLANGTSYTVLTIGGVLDHKFRVVLMKKYVGRDSEAIAQVDDILSVINYFGVKFVIADSGDGRTSNAMIVKAIGAERFGECFEHGSLKQKLKWDRRQGMYIINRSRVMTDRFMEIKRGEIEFFNYEKFKDFGEDFLNIYSDYSEITRKTIYDHSGPDDAFHSYMFCRLACMISRGEMNKYIFGGDNESLVEE